MEGSSNVSAAAPLSVDCVAITCRAVDDMVTLAHIRDQHRLSLQSYGRPRMTGELQELGLKVGHRRVGRLMRENGIKIIRTRKYKATTDSNHAFNIAPNLLGHKQSPET
jgi:putative transposase